MCEPGSRIFPYFIRHIGVLLSNLVDCDKLILILYQEEEEEEEEEKLSGVRGT